MATAKKGRAWHVSSRDGIPRPCNAKPGRCPYGNQMTSHYNNVEDALDAADVINESIAKGVDFNSEVVVLKGKNGQGIISPKAEKLLQEDRSLSLATKKFNEVRQDLSKQLSEQLQGTGIKSLKIDGEDVVGTLSVVSESSRRNFNEEAFKQSFENTEDYESYLNIVKRDDSIEHIGKSTRQAATDNYSKVSITTPRSEIKLDFEKDENGEVKLSDESYKKIENYIKFTNTIKEMEATHKANRNRLSNAMKEAEVDSITMRGGYIQYTPEHYDVKLDRNKIKEDGLYDDYVEKSVVASHVRFRASK